MKNNPPELFLQQLVDVYLLLSETGAGETIDEYSYDNNYPHKW